MRTADVADRRHDHTRQPHAAMQVALGDICLVAHDKRGVPALRLQKELEVSYPTAWLMLHKIRHGRGERDEENACAGGRVAGFGQEDRQIREDGGS